MAKMKALVCRECGKEYPTKAIHVCEMSFGPLEAKLRKRGTVVTSQDVGLEVLSRLRKLDEVAYIRFASVYKDFQEITDFEQELGLLLQKRAPAGSASSSG